MGKEYQEIKDEKGNILVFQRMSDNAFIPADPGNKDYIALQDKIAKQGKDVVVDKAI